VRDGAGEKCLRTARWAFEKDVTVRQRRHEHELDCALLTHDNLRDLVLSALAKVCKSFETFFHEECH